MKAEAKAKAKAGWRVEGARQVSFKFFLKIFADVR
jgi:hypothetical protein